MEESEKRRERLKAMRTEASQATNSYATPRFDYYTDPMSAFSADKRRGNVSNLHSQYCLTPPRPRHPEMTPPPAYQPRPNYSPDQRMYRARGPHHSSGPRNPEMTPSPAQHVQTNYSPDQRMYQARGPYHGSGPRNPEMIPSPAYQPQPNYSLVKECTKLQTIITALELVISPVLDLEVALVQTPVRAEGAGFPALVQGLEAALVLILEEAGVAGLVSGRGGRGGGLGSHDSVSAELRPDLYYNKSMIEDPWKFLEPVIWSGNISVKSWNTPSTLESPFPNSTGVKKARISESTSASSSQPSLAEYLAAAFNEAVNDEGSHGKPN
ncbi:hypothetical protein Acr_11g0003800 [Actinidia rufa]|uniref:Uncharacterized protein n=1 Tax=Actinidia rufa TaxID=165716 RepID=A0A7J0FBG4_9ERIC|nr:hypothetical protein Acr_11g0003800 [Actinidia rufa]